MLHLGAALPNIGFAADAHCHHLLGDIIQAGPFRYRNGCIALPKGPDLVGELDRDKVAEYAAHYHCHGGCAYDHDPMRPHWYSIIPGRNLADPAKGAIAL